MLDDTPVTCVPLPPYTVRRSDRARHVRLTVNARDGLVVVVPRRWQGDAAAIVAAKRTWAERSLADVAERRALHVAGPSALLPDVIDVRMTGETLGVTYLETRTGSARVIRSGDTLRVTGTGDAEARLSALSRWLDRLAREVLPARAWVLSDRHGLAPSDIRVTRARSRWGSCSTRGSVALNRALVFLPPHLVDALILHEIAHLRVMDHSPRFWAELERLDEDAQHHRVELRRAMASVPAWAEV